MQRNKEEGGGFKQTSFHLLRSSNFCKRLWRLVPSNNGLALMIPSPRQQPVLCWC